MKLVGNFAYYAGVRPSIPNFLSKLAGFMGWLDRKLRIGSSLGGTLLPIGALFR